MIDNLNKFIRYFFVIYETHTLINGFVFGDSGRITSDRLEAMLRDSKLYPVLFLESPDIRFSYNNNANKVTFTTGLVLLSNAAHDNWNDQDEEMKNTYMIFMDIFKKMIIDAKAQQFIFSLDTVSMQPLDNITIDNALGWRAEFQLSGYIDLSSPEHCNPSTVWES